MVNKPAATVYLVDDNWCIREALATLLTAYHFQVRAFESGLALLNEFKDSQQKCAQKYAAAMDCPACIINLPGCLVLDVQMPVMTGLELQQELIKLAVSMPIIFLSAYADVSVSAQAFKAGAFDFFEKPYDNLRLIQRIEEALVADSIATEQRCTKCKIQTYYRSLTDREKDVFALIVKGYSNKEIAKLLTLSHRTVETHRAHLMEKMRAENLADLIMTALSYGLVK